MDVYYVLILIYFSINSYITGFAHGDESKVWYFILLGVLFGIPIVLLVLLRYSINDKLWNFDWYKDFRFWIDLNLTNKWQEVEYPNQIERTVNNRGDERTKSQWERIKKKYNHPINAN